MTRFFNLKLLKVTAGRSAHAIDHHPDQPRPGMRHGKCRSAPTRWSRAILLATLLLGSVMTPAAADGPLRISGSGANVGAIQLIAQEFRKHRPDVIFSPIEAVGSGGAIKAVASGALTIALISRPLNAQEETLGLKAIEYARTPFVIAVRTDSRIQTMTSDRLATILDGSAGNGPDGTRLRPVLRPPGDIDTALLKSLAARAAPNLDEALKRSGMMIATTDREAADLIENNSGTIGTTTLGLILSESRRLRALNMDGAAPTLAALEAGKYPYQKRLFLVVSTKLPTTEPVNAFLDYVTSPPARAVLKRTGHLVPPFNNTTLAGV